MSVPHLGRKSHFFDIWNQKVSWNHFSNTIITIQILKKSSIVHFRHRQQVKPNREVQCVSRRSFKGRGLLEMAPLCCLQPVNCLTILMCTIALTSINPIQKEPFLSLFWRNEMNNKRNMGVSWTKLPSQATNYSKNLTKSKIKLKRSLIRWILIEIY